MQNNNKKVTEEDEAHYVKKMCFLPSLAVAHFLRSEESNCLNSIDAILLTVIANYCNLTSKRICFAKMEALMHDSKIKNKTSYIKHINRLIDRNLIKKDRKWKVVNYSMGSYFDNYAIESCKKLGTENVLDEPKSSFSGTHYAQSSTENVLDQVRETYSTIEKENVEKEKEKENILPPIFPLAEICVTVEEKIPEGESKEFDQPKQELILTSNPTSDNKESRNSKPKKKNKLQESRQFQEFWKIYPKQTKKLKSLKLWQREHLDEIADAIIEDVKIRISNHEPWVRNIIDGTRERLTSPLDYLEGEYWVNEEIILTTHKGEQNESRGYHQQQKRTLIARAQDKIAAMRSRAQAAAAL